MVCGRNDCEGVGSSSIRIEQVPQGFPCPDWKQNEYGVPVSWHREIIIQGFDPVEQGLKNICGVLYSSEVV
eukprot:13893658-Ditylum_brightwellii.AAC.1